MKKCFCAGTEKFCAGKVNSSAQPKQVNLPDVGKKLRFSKLHMPEWPSHNRVQFWRRFDAASIVEY